MTSFLNSKKRLGLFVGGLGGVLICGGISIYFLVGDGNEESTPLNDQPASPPQPVHYSVSVDTIFFENSEEDRRPKVAVNTMHKKVIKTCEEARNTLNRALELKNVEKSKLEELFAIVKKFCPQLETPDDVIGYATKFYEGMKKEETANPIPQRVKKLKRLRNRVKKLNPSYVDQPTLEQAVGSKLIENLNTVLSKPADKVSKESLADAFRNAKVLGTPADHQALAYNTVKEYLEDRGKLITQIGSTGASDQITQNNDSNNQNSIAPLIEITPGVIEQNEMNTIISNNADPTTMPTERAAVSEAAQQLLDERNKELRKLCDLKNVIPSEAKKEFNDWKASGFNIESSPKFAELLQKVQTAKQQKEIITQSLLFHFTQEKCAKEVYKHSKDLEEKVLKAKQNDIVAAFLHFTMEAGFQLTPQILDWLKADDFNKISSTIDSLCSDHSSQVKTFLDGLISLSNQWNSPEKGYFQATSAYYEIRKLKLELQSRGFREPDDVNEYWSQCQLKWENASSNAYEYYNFLIAQRRAEYENAENNFKGTNNTIETEKLKSIFEPVHIKLAAMLFMKNFREKDKGFLLRKARELGLTSVQKLTEIEEKDYDRFSGHYKALNQLVLHNISIRIESADFQTIREISAKHAEEYKKVQEENSALDEAMSLVSKIRKGSCSLTATGHIDCKSKILQARYIHPQWLGKDVFMPTQPFISYFSDLEKQQRAIHVKFSRFTSVDSFFADPYFFNSFEFFS